jgi:hypothetical protein
MPTKEGTPQGSQSTKHPGDLYERVDAWSEKVKKHLAPADEGKEREGRGGAVTK